MKITQIIKANTQNKQSPEDTEGQANRLKLTHDRLISELEMKKIDLDFQLRNHMASTNVCGDINMWSQQLIEIKKKINLNNSDLELAIEIKKDLFTD